MGLAGERAGAAEQLVPQAALDAPPRAGDVPLAPDAPDEQSARQVDAGRGGDGDLEPCSRGQDAADRRAHQRPEPLQRARGDVGRYELARRARQQGHERERRRANRRTDDRRQSGESEDEHAGALCRQCDCHGDQQQRARNVDPEQHSLPRIAVGEHAAERQRDRRRHHPREAERTHCRRAAHLEGVDGQGDEVRPLAEVEAGPRELEPAQLGIAEDVRQS